MKSFARWCIAAPFVFCAALVSGSTPQGSLLFATFQVNAADTYQDDIGTSIGADALGNVTIAWMQSYGNGTNVMVKRFDSHGQSLGAESPANAALGLYNWPAVGQSRSSGDFVVVWTGNPQVVQSPWYVYARLFHSDGTPKGPQLTLSDGTLSDGSEAEPNQVFAAMNNAGQFVIGWNDQQDQQTGRFAIFSATGQMVGQVQLESGPIWGVGISGDGHAVAGHGKLLHCYTASGGSASGDVAAFADPSLIPAGSTLDQAEDGSIAVAYEALRPVSGSYVTTIYGRMMDQNCNAAGNQFTALPEVAYNAYLTPSGSISLALDGNELGLAWEQRDTTNSSKVTYQPLVRLLSTDGSPLSDPVALRPASTYSTLLARGAFGGDHNLWLGWSVIIDSTSSSDVFAVPVQGVDTNSPESPINLTATPGNAQVTLNWTASSGAASYQVFEGTAAAGESSTPVQTGITGTGTSIGGLSNGTTYYFVVKAENAGGLSPASSEASATPVPPPSAPRITAVPGESQVTLNWSAVTYATNYSVYQGSSAGGESVTPVQSGISGTGATITGLNAGTTYYFTVKASNTVGTSPASNEVSSTPEPPPPPPMLAATAGNATVTLNWTAASGATSYQIFRGTSPGGEGATPVQSGVSGLSTTMGGLANGTTYYFIVKGINGGVAGAASNEASATPVAPPPAPTNLAANPGNAQIVLTWAASARATSYQVFQGASAGGEGSTAVATVTGTTATIANLSNGITYYFTVKASNAAGVSPASGEASARPVAPPAAPSDLTATAGNHQVSLSWTSVYGATSYQIFQGASAGAEGGTAVATVSGTSTTLGGLSNGTTYYFIVKASNAGGLSRASNEASATTLLPAPTGFTATAGDSKVSLSWNAAAGAATYNVYQGTAAGGESAVPVRSGLTGTSIDVTGLSNGTAYYFFVRARIASGASPPSNEASATPEPLPPPAPTGLAAVMGDSKVTLNWTAAARAASYEVYVGTSPGGESGTPVLSAVTATSATVTGLVDGTTYYFVVTARNAGGTSARSNEASAKPLGAPSGLSAAAGDRSAALHWTAAAGGATYNVYQGTAAGGESAAPVQSGLTGTSTNVTGLTNGTTYYFVVRARNVSGSSPNSNEVGVTPEPPAPPAPAGVAATPGDGKVSLSWKAAANAATYNVYQGTAAGGESAAPVRSGLTGTSIDVTGLSNGTAYYFFVRARNVSGISPPSNEVGATPVPPAPPAPAGMVATAGDKQASLSWNAATGAATYNVYQGTAAGGESTAPVRSGLTGTSINITGLTNGSTYYFVVRARNAGGISPASNEASATPEPPPPPAPAGVAATAGDGKVSLGWRAVAGATSYSVYQGTAAGGESSTPVQTGITGTSATITGLSDGTTYYFFIKAGNAGGQSPPSAEVSATPIAPPPAPTGVAATAGDGKVSLSWSAAAGATSYSVYQGSTAGGESSTAVQTGITGTSATITGLSDGTTYYFFIKGGNAAGQSPPSAEVSATPIAPPQAPAGVAATAGDRQVGLGWNAVAGADTYNVYQGTAAGGESTAPVRSGLTGTSTNITGLSNGTAYYFVVRARNAGGASPISNEASAAPAPPPATTRHP